MRVVVPATDRSPHLGAVRDALNAAGVAHEVHLCHGDTGYWRLLAALWARAETFVIVEHDVVVDAGTIVELADCGREWCAAPYPYLSGTIVGLGCTKFAAALIRRVPDAVERAGALTDAGHPARHWCRLDAWMQRALRDSGEFLHFDHTPVGHLNRSGRPAHACR